MIRSIRVNIFGLNIFTSMGFFTIDQMIHGGLKHHGEVAASAKTSPILSYHASLGDGLLLLLHPCRAVYHSSDMTKLMLLKNIKQ
jgi:hypothetical protein